MSNTLYYTFSTIAQALAGAIALLGAFVLFRLQSLSLYMSGAGGILVSAWLGDVEIHQYFAAGDFRALLVRADHLVAQPIPSGWGVTHQTALEGMRLALSRRRQILRGLARTLLVATVVMIAAVAVLAIVHQIAGSASLANVALVAGVAAFSLSVIAMARFVWDIARGA